MTPASFPCATTPPPLLNVVVSVVADVSFVVHKTTPGFRVTKMENKIGLRIVQNGDITLVDAFVPDEDRLPGVESFQDTNKATALPHAVLRHVSGTCPPPHLA